MPEATRDSSSIQNQRPAPWFPWLLDKAEEGSGHVQADGQDYTRTHPARGQGGSFPKLAPSPALSLHIPACASTAEGHPRLPHARTASREQTSRAASGGREGGSGEWRRQGPEQRPLRAPAPPHPLGTGRTAPPCSETVWRRRARVEAGFTLERKDGKGELDSESPAGGS